MNTFRNFLNFLTIVLIIGLLHWYNPTQAQPAPPDHGQTGNQPAPQGGSAPVGSGLGIMLVLASGYMVVKRVRNKKKLNKALLLLAFVAGSTVVQAQVLSSLPVRAQAQVTDTAALLRIAAEQSVKSQTEKAEAERFARENNLPVRSELSGGGVIELMRFENGKPVYYITHNQVAAKSISTDKIRPGGIMGLNLTGTGRLLGIWDGGNVLTTHQELTGRVTDGDIDGITDLSDHATHVAGTMIASGVSGEAKGMAYEASLKAYDWNNDASEMATAAAAGLKVSNHSYGYITGWYYDSKSGNSYWYGDYDISQNEDVGFGNYQATEQLWDQVAYNAPYYLIVKSAGNDRGDTPGSGPRLYWDETNNEWATFPGELPENDGGTDGYDCLASGASNSKNILTVGAVNDIPGGYSQPSDVVMSSFSGWGPTDDGRIKPEIVANGIGLRSSISTGNAKYGSMSGTSMSSPSVTGSVALLQQHWVNTFGSECTSAMMRALLIHTADEAGPNPGPDYMFGYGMMNSAASADLITKESTAAGHVNMIQANLQQDQTTTLTVVADGGPLKVTLSWIDPPGTPLSPLKLNDRTAMLVNNLNVKITNAVSNTYYPWLLNPDSPSTAAVTGVNQVDNIEQILLADTEPGDQYTIIISHTGTLSGGSQNYALIITGIITDPVAPLNFTANASGTSQIDLEWQTNPASGKVLLLAKRQPITDVPTDGTIYLAGESLANGAAVLYTGTNASFSHSLLQPGEVWYYRLFAYDNNQVYSNGLDAFAITTSEVPYMRPNSITAESSDNLNVVVSWTSPLLEDNFNSYPDFSTNFRNWTQWDLDGMSTYGFSNYDFTNEYYTGAFIIFNPSATSPSLAGVSAMQPYSGSKYAACFSASPGPNNDWLITPRIKINNGDRLQFMAKSYTSSPSPERFKVGISTSATVSTPTDFTIIPTGTYFEAPAAYWKLYDFDLSAYNGQQLYLAINCITNTSFFLMIDDFKVVNASGATKYTLMDDDRPSSSEPEEYRPSNSIIHKSLARSKSMEYGSPLNNAENLSDSAGKAPATIISSASLQYELFRDGLSLGSGLTGYTYTDNNPGNGPHSYTVKAVYSTTAPGTRYDNITSAATNPVVVYTGLKNWIGGASGNLTDWNTASNWNPTGVPQATDYVTIPVTASGNYPTLSASAGAVEDLLVANGASVTIASSGKLTVNGDITGVGSTPYLTIKSDATGTGSLIVNGQVATGNKIKMERYITGGWESAYTGWHFLSAPVIGQTISSFTTSGVGNDYDFYGWKEVSGLWMNQKAADFSTWNSGSDFKPGRGYFVSYEQTQTKTFSGGLTDSDVTLTNLSHSGDDFTGWHLLGNPYPSGLTWNTTGWNLSNVAGLAKVWKEADASYTDINPGGIIAPAQGFMVQVSSGTNSLTIPRSARTHETAAWLKSETPARIVLYASDQAPTGSMNPGTANSGQRNTWKQTKQHLILQENTLASADYDLAYDSRFLAGYAPQLWSVCGTEMLSTNALPELFNPQENYTLGFVKNTSDRFVIGISENTSGAVPYLFDRKVQIWHDLSKESYTFSSEETDDPLRFELRFSPIGLPEDAGFADLRAWSSSGILHLYGAESFEEALVFDSRGSVCKRFTLNGAVQQELSLQPLATGIYSVMLIDRQSGKTISHKFLWDLWDM